VTGDMRLGAVRQGSRQSWRRHGRKGRSGERTGAHHRRRARRALAAG